MLTALPGACSPFQSFEYGGRQKFQTEISSDDSKISFAQGNRKIGRQVIEKAGYEIREQTGVKDFRKTEGKVDGQAGP